MADPKIKIRRSATPNKVPTKDQLQLGELAINTYDGKLYLEQDQGGVGVGNTVVVVNPWSVGVGSTAYNTHFTAGKVGVGTTNAQYNLDVGGNVNFTGNLYQNGSIFTSGSTGVGIATAGGIAGYAATVIDFRGPGVTTAYYSSATGIGTVYFHSVTSGGGGGGGGGASVTVSDSAPGSPSNGDLWFKSDVAELYVYYTDGSSNQWVEASGGSNTVVTSDNAPTSPQDGDLWWNSNTGELKVYYNDGNTSQWVDANSEGGFIQYWTQTNTNGTIGITTTGFVGIGTTTATDALTVSGNANLTGFLTATQLNGAVSSTGVNVSGVATALNLIAPVTSSGVNVTGVATALQLKGPLTSSGINVTGVSTFSAGITGTTADFSGNVTIGGILTYEDVKNVDAIGIVTARKGLKVLAGGANIVDGTTTDELNVTGVATAVQLNATTTNVSGVSTFAGNIDANGDLDVDGITNLDDVSITGVSTFAGNIDANGDLDVDGHTELDNVNVVGIATIQQVKGTTLNVTGVSTVTGGVKVGTAATICSEGNMTIDRPSAGIITATKFIGDGSDLTGVISGIGIGTAGGVVGYAATIVHFKGAGVTTAYYNATTGIGTIFFHSATTGGGGGGGANVTVSDTPPGSPTAGDLWWESDIGELKIYYSDGDSSQWVDANGADSLVQIGTSAPTGAVSGDLWFNSETGDFMVYYADVNTSQWVSVNAVNSNTKWITNATGIHTTGNVGIGTTTATDPLTVVGATDLDGTLLVSGITTFGSHVYHGDNDHAIFGDGSDLSLYHDSSNSWIKNTTGNLTLNSNIIHLKDGGNNKNYLRTYTNDRVEIYFNNGEKFRTTNTGVSVTGTVVATGADINGDIDVDGHTNLDNVSVAGVSTFAGNAQFNSNLNVLGTLTYEDVKNVDALGISTARQGLNVTGGGIHVTSGVVTATSFVGGLPITNGVDNRVITASSATAIQGESSLTFNGTQLEVNGSSTNYPIKVSGTANAKVLLTGATSPYIQWQQGTTNKAYAWWDSNNNRFELKNEQENSYVRIDSVVNFSTGGSERLRCDADGVKTLNGRFYSAGTFAYIESSSTSVSTLTLKKSASGADAIDYLQLRDNSNVLKLKIGGDGIIYTPDVLASHEGDADTKIRFPAADQIQFDTGGTNYLKLHRYASVNFVEVGSAAQFSFANNGANGRSILIGDANASSTGSMHLQAGGGSTGFGGGIRLYSHANSTNAGGVYIGKSLNSSGSIILGNGGTSPTHEYVHINSSGKVRVGSGSATYNFEVQTTGFVETLIGSTNAGGAGIILDGDSNGDGSGGDYAQIFHQNDGSLNFRARNGSGGTDTIFLSGTSEKFRISSGGKILLGTTRTYYSNEYYDDITINNSGASGGNGGCGITMISSSDSWGAVQFGDSDDDDVGYIKYSHGGNYMRFATGGSIRARLDSDGLKFHGDTAAANGLDDYEEGSFTPSVSSGLAAGQISYNSRSGNYTKIGNLVTFTLHMNISSCSLDSGALKFGGLPKTAINDSHKAGGCYLTMSNGNMGTDKTYRVVANSTDIQVITAAGDAFAANSSSLNAGNRSLSIHGSYYTNS